MQAFVVIAATLASRSAPAVTVWSGLTHAFSKPDNENPPYTADILTASVSITRGFTRGLYNGKLESGWTGTGPSGTRWATDLNNEGKTIAAANFAALDFLSAGTWIEAFGGPNNLGDLIVGRDAVVWLEEDDIYLDLRFTHWQASGGGGFAYLRAVPPAVVTTGDYNGDMVVDGADYVVWRNTLGEAVMNQGDGADGVPDGVIKFDDYLFWKSRYGVTVTSDATIVPEPESLALCAVLAAASAVRRSRRCVALQHNNLKLSAAQSRRAPTVNLGGKLTACSRRLRRF